jgi:hypothetical protein
MRGGRLYSVARGHRDEQLEDRWRTIPQPILLRADEAIK